MAGLNFENAFSLLARGGVGWLRRVFSGPLQEAKHGFGGFGLDACLRVLRQDDAASVKEPDSGRGGARSDHVSGGHEAAHMQAASARIARGRATVLNTVD